MRPLRVKSDLVVALGLQGCCVFQPYACARKAGTRDGRGSPSSSFGLLEISNVPIAEMSNRGQRWPISRGRPTAALGIEPLRLYTSIGSGRFRRTPAATRAVNERGPLPVIGRRHPRIWRFRWMGQCRRRRARSPRCRSASFASSRRRPSLPGRDRHRRSA